MPQRILSSIKQILPNRKKSAFGSLEVYPYDVKFATQNKGEKIFIKTRSHVVTNLGWLIRAVFTAVVPVMVLLIIDIFRLSLTGTQFNDFAIFIEEVQTTLFSIPFGLTIILTMFYYSILISYVLIQFLNWYLDIYLVTNERILHMTFTSLTGKRIAETTLANIQDISQKELGFLPSFFNYGDVRIQTAAERNQFYLKAVPDPTWFRDVISDLSKLVQADEP